MDRNSSSQCFWVRVSESPPINDILHAAAQSLELVAVCNSSLTHRLESGLIAVNVTLKELPTAGVSSFHFSLPPESFFLIRMSQRNLSRCFSISRHFTTKLCCDERSELKWIGDQSDLKSPGIARQTGSVEM
jgi:hypothetical protein